MKTYIAYLLSRFERCRQV